MTSNNPILQEGLQAAIDSYHAGRLADAIQGLERLGKRFSNSAKLWGYLGFLYREANDLSSAVRCFRKCVAISPRSERASLGLFHALWRLHRDEEALQELGRFAQIGKPQEYLQLLRRSGRARSQQPAMA